MTREELDELERLAEAAIAGRSSWSVSPRKVLELIAAARRGLELEALGAIHAILKLCNDAQVVEANIDEAIQQERERIFEIIRIWDDYNRWDIGLPEEVEACIRSGKTIDQLRSELEGGEKP